MKKIFWTGLVLAAVLMFEISRVASAASFANGGFETGNLTGWESSGSGYASVVTSNAGYTATAGQYFAQITANGLIKQNQSWLAGETLKFDWNFNANDYMPYNDYSLLSIKNSQGGIIDNITLSNVAATGNYNATGWNSYTYKFANAGTGSIGFGVYNALDNSLPSQLYIDNVVGGVAPPASKIYGLFYGVQYPGSNPDGKETAVDTTISAQLAKQSISNINGFQFESLIRTQNITEQTIEDDILNLKFRTCL